MSRSSLAAHHETTEETVARIARTVRPVAEGDSRIAGLYLFGSQANGEAHEDSDVDLGVLFDGPVDLWHLIDLEDAFEVALGRHVDLIDLRKAEAFLALDITRGERIYEGDGEACDEFDLFVMRRAGDLAPFERQRRALALRDSR